MLLASDLDVHLHLIVEHHARELLLRLETRHHRGDVPGDAGPREVVGAKRRGVHGHDTHHLAGRKHAVDERYQHEARGEDGDGDGGGHIGLVHGEEAAVGGDGAHSLALEGARPLDEGGQESPLAVAHHEVRRGTAHPMVEHGEIEGRGIAHVAGNARELGVEHENAHRETVDVLPASHSHAGILGLVVDGAS